MKKKLLVVFLSAALAVCAFACVSCKKEPPAVTYAYTLSDTALSLGVGQSKQLSVTSDPEKEFSVEYSVDDPTVASVSEAGLVTALKEGAALVTAKADGQSLTCAVTVTEYTLNFIELELERTDTKQLSVSNAQDKPMNVSYESTDPAVATVSETGLVTAVAPGETEIKVAVNGASLTCSVTVREKYSYSLDKESLDLAAGGGASLKLTVAPAKADLSFTYTSEDPTVAAVEPGTGVVTGVGKGSTRIVCMADGKELFCAVTVTRYALSETEASVREGETLQLAVTADPQREFAVEYLSSDEATATVTAEGLVTAVKPGPARITAKVAGIELTCDVTVTPSYEYSLDETELVFTEADATQKLNVSVTPAKPDMNVTWRSSDEAVATVATDGTVTAVGLGSCTITATADGEELTCNVAVTLPSSLTETNASGPYNLTALDPDYLTSDWRFYGDNGYAEQMKDADLIGQAPAADRYFSDFKGVMSWTDGTVDKTGSARTDGWVFTGTVTFDVVLSSDVKKVVVFVGAYNATNKVSFVLDGHTLQSYSFTSSGASVNKVVTLELDTAALAAGTKNLTVKMERLGDNPDNISLVAAAVISGTARPAVDSATVTYAATKMTGTQNSKIDLSTKGTADWYYLNFENDDGDGKSNGTAIKTETLHFTGKNSFWDYPAMFTWTDGTKWASSPKDKGDDGGSWNWCASEDERGTNNGYCGNAIDITVDLSVGRHTVYLYVSGYQSTYGVSVVDPSANPVFSQKVTDGDGVNTQAFEVALTLDVKTAGDYVFGVSLLTAGGNVGLAAVAVA